MRAILRTLLGAVIVTALFIGVNPKCFFAYADGPGDAGGAASPVTFKYYVNSWTPVQYLSSAQTLCSYFVSYSNSHNVLVSSPNSIGLNRCYDGYQDGDPIFGDYDRFYDDGSSYPDQFTHILVGVLHILTCPADDTIAWPQGTSGPPVCQPNQNTQCASQSGQTFPLVQQCGVAHCPAGSVLALSGSTQFECSGGTPESFTAAGNPHPSPINHGGCEAIYVSTLNGAIDSASLGNQSAPAYCEDTYEYNGQVATDADASANSGLPNSALASDTSPMGNGSCPSGTSYGTGPLGTTCYGTPDGGANSGANSGNNGTGTGTANSGNTDGNGNNTGDDTANSGSIGGSADSGGAHGTAFSGAASGTAGSASTSTICNNPPTCNGDAVNCAILTQEWTDTCNLMAPPTSDQEGTAEGMASSAAGDYDTANGNFSEGVGSAFGNWLTNSTTSHYSGQCFADVQFSVLNGQSLTLPFSKICAALGIFKGIIMALGLLIGGRVVLDAALS